jgi:hypothetical protein
MTTQLTILKQGKVLPESAGSSRTIDFDELRRLIARGAIVGHFCGYRQARLLYDRIDVIPKPFLMAVLLRLLAKKQCFFEDNSGRRQHITLRVLWDLFIRLLRDLVRKRRVLRGVSGEVERLSHVSGHSTGKSLDLSASPVYLRTDLA